MDSMYAQDLGLADTAQPSRDADLATLAMTVEPRFQPLAKYFERGVTMGEWEAVHREAIGTFEPCDRILSWQFRASLRARFPRLKTWIVYVTPVPHDSLRPKAACKLSHFNGRARLEFTTYEAALATTNLMHRNKYAATAPEESRHGLAT